MTVRQIIADQTEEGLNCSIWLKDFSAVAPYEVVFLKNKNDSDWVIGKDQSIII